MVPMSDTDPNHVIVWMAPNRAQFFFDIEMGTSIESRLIQLISFQLKSLRKLIILSPLDLVAKNKASYSDVWGLALH